MPNIRSVRKEKVKDIEQELGWKCNRHEDNGADSDEHMQECMGEMLLSYINEDNNYVVDGATISCDQMSDEMVTIRYDEGKIVIKGEGGSIEKVVIGAKKQLGEHFFQVQSDNEDIRRLYAVHATEQTDNDTMFATVLDRACLRDIEEGWQKMKKQAL